MKIAYLPFVLMFALINSCIELEISAPSFPDIMSSLQVSDTMVGLTITYNLIGFCIAALIYGPLSECYGRRRTMLIGNGILVIGAIGCVLAPTIQWLLFSRLIQGLGAATSAVIVSTIIADVYSTKKAAKLYGIMNAVFTTLMAIAPVIGGFINAAIGWRGNYAAVATICVISWVLLLLFLAETKPVKENLRITKIIKDYKQLYSSTLFVCSAAIPSLLYGCYMAFVAVAPFIYMQEFGLNIFTYTLHQGSVAAAFALTSAFAARITDLLGAKKVVMLALGVAIFGSVYMLFATYIYLITLSMCIFCVGFALLFPIIVARSMEIFPKLKGTASSAIMSLRTLLCASITGLASYLYDGNSIVLAAVICSTIIITSILTSYLLIYKKDFILEL